MIIKLYNVEISCFNFVFIQNFWVYLKNILRNQHVLSFSKIQKFWKIFNNQDFYENGDSESIINNDEADLNDFLDNKIVEKCIVFSNGEYTLFEE